MKRSIWVRTSENMLADLGFRPTTVSVPRELQGGFAMADGYAVPEQDFDDIVQLLTECKVVHAVE